MGYTIELSSLPNYNSTGYRYQQRKAEGRRIDEIHKSVSVWGRWGSGGGRRKRRDGGLVGYISRSQCGADRVAGKEGC